MENRRCSVCGKSFRPHPQVPMQSYCAARACQRARRRRWQRVKRRTDPDYLDNQARAQRAWRKRNPDYWRKYRLDHQQYLESNRKRQRERNRRRRRGPVVKMDTPTASFAMPSGIYKLSEAPPNGIAKMGAWIVQITLLSVRDDRLVTDCKETT